jgi:hypothetical protein
MTDPTGNITDRTEWLKLIDRAKASLAAITPGPWMWEGDSFSDQPSNCPHGTQWTDHGPNLVRADTDPDHYIEDDHVITSNGYDASGLEINTANAEFIAAAPELVRELIVALEHLTKT